MAVPQRKPDYHTPEEYLAREREATFRSEYFDGDIYAMAGSSPEHSAITANVTIALGAPLRGGPCRVFSSDLKVRIGQSRQFFYPDLSVVCGEPRFHDAHRDVLLNPTVLVEVLSPSTEAFDRGRKFAQYQTIPSLTDYLLIAQDEPRVELFTRQADDRWLLTTASGRESRIEIASLGCTLPLSEIYDRVAFPPLPAEAEPQPVTQS